MQNSDRPLVVAVVLHWNRYSETRACLESLMSAQYRRLQVLLVDNGSTDESARRLEDEFPAVHVVYNGENLGYARGNNVGIRLALNMGAQYVLVLNNDTVVEPNFLGPLVSEGQSNPLVGALSGTVLYLTEEGENRTIAYAGGSLSFWRASGVYDYQGQAALPHRLGTSKDVTFISGCAFLVKRKALEEVGLFDERFHFGVEDVDYSWRLTRNGYRIRYVPASEIWHKKAASRSFSAGEFYNAVVSKCIFVQKHTPRLLFILWWSVYAGRTLVLLNRFVRDAVNLYGASHGDAKELRSAIVKGLRSGFSQQAESSFTVPE